MEHVGGSTTYERLDQLLFVGLIVHQYGSDSDERRNVPFFMGIISLLFAWLFHQAQVTSNIDIPWWFDAPSVLGFFGLVFWAFDKWLWKAPIIRTLPFLKTPDLNGTWQGQIKSSFNQHATHFEATLTIKQTWTELAVLMETSGSKSVSKSAMIVTNDLPGPTLSYEYLNEPKSHAVETMATHRGYACLMFVDRADALVLDGEYYTGRGRQNFGALHFELSKSVGEKV